MPSHTDKSGETSRRDFFKKAAAIGLGTVLGSAAFGRPNQVMAQITLPKGPIPRRPFGRSGIMVSALSLGGMFDILNNRLVLAKALEWGINYWDTAEGYGGGRSEEGIGRWFARKPETRKDIFLVTKLSPRKGVDDFTSRLEESLKRLRGPALRAWNPFHQRDGGLDGVLVSDHEKGWKDKVVRLQHPFQHGGLP
jgi:hypothetical protein